MFGGSQCDGATCPDPWTSYQPSQPGNLCGDRCWSRIALGSLNTASESPSLESLCRSLQGFRSIVSLEGPLGKKEMPMFGALLPFFKARLCEKILREDSIHRRQNEQGENSIDHGKVSTEF